jgi:cyclophilin family peptidyl-prolyl cis-trans isomerase
MVSRVGITLAICFCAAIPAAAQRVVRFETTVGDFDMVLNPTNDPRLQGHVDNMIAYVQDHRYDGNWINRAVEGFVLQMGGSYSNTSRPPMTIESTRSVSTFPRVAGAPADDIGLSNTRGTVALALPSDENDIPLKDFGTSSFFINLADTNTFLDPHFTVFAAIPERDMAVVDEIMALAQVDLRSTLQNSAAFKDIPVTPEGKQVFIRQAFLVTDALDATRARAGVQSTMVLSVAGGGNGGSASLISSTAVPEPASAAILLLGLFSLTFRRRRQRR